MMRAVANEMQARRRQTTAKHDGGQTTTMWILFLEAAVALCIAIFIVWWTWPKNSDRDKQ